MKTKQPTQLELYMGNKFMYLKKLKEKITKREKK